MGFVPTGIIALIFGLAMVLGALWLWLCWQARCSGWRGTIGKLALQGSLLMLVWGLIRRQGLESLLMVTVPPFAVLELYNLQVFSDLLVTLAPYALPPAILVLIVALVLPQIRIWSPSLTVGTGFVAALLAAGPLLDTRMCQSAADRGTDRVARNSFLFSLTHAPREYQFDLHGLITIDDQPWGWSYRLMDWYPIPPEAADNMTYALPQAVACPTA